MTPWQNTRFGNNSTKSRVLTNPVFDNSVKGLSWPALIHMGSQWDTRNGINGVSVVSTNMAFPRFCQIITNLLIYDTEVAAGHGTVLLLINPCLLTKSVS